MFCLLVFVVVVEVVVVMVGWYCLVFLVSLFGFSVVAAVATLYRLRSLLTENSANE